MPGLKKTGSCLSSIRFWHFGAGVCHCPRRFGYSFVVKRGCRDVDFVSRSLACLLERWYTDYLFVQQSGERVGRMSSGIFRPSWKIMTSCPLVMREAL